MKIADETFAEYVKKSYTIADVCRMIKIRPIGGNYRTVKARIKRLGLDTSHFTGRGHNKGKKLPFRGMPLDEIMVENSTYTNSNSLRKRLLNEGIKKANCEKCEKCNMEWYANTIGIGPY